MPWDVVHCTLASTSTGNKKRCTFRVTYPLALCNVAQVGAVFGTSHHELFSEGPGVRAGWPDLTPGCSCSRDDEARTSQAVLQKGGPDHPAVVVTGGPRAEHPTSSSKKVKCEYLALPTRPSESASSSDAQLDRKYHS